MATSIACVLMLSAALDATDRQARELMAGIESSKAGDDGLIPVSISVNNSVVDVHTPVIDRIVDIGLPAVPHLVAEMEKRDVSFHRFTYCYSACNQILRKDKRRSNFVFWSGGCDFDGDTIIPRGQRDISAFRASVVADIKAKYEQTSIKR